MQHLLTEQAWSSDPGEGGIGITRHPLEIDMRQFSGQTRAVNINGFNHNCNENIKDLFLAMTLIIIRK